jgi:hypothetical protein
MKLICNVENFETSTLLQNTLDLIIVIQKKRKEELLFWIGKLKRQC